MGRLPHKPPNGTGFATNPKKKASPFNLDSSYTTLTKPFKVPFKLKNGNSSKNCVFKPDIYVKRPTRAARDKAAKILQNLNFNTVYDPDAKDEKDLVNENENDNGDDDKTRLNKRIDALSVTRYLENANTIQVKLSSKFSIPIKNYARTHNLSLQLGMKPNLSENLPPRPLHDPYGELAIVLYDPTVDGDMPDCEPEKIETPLQTEKTTKRGRKKKLKNKSDSAENESNDNTYKEITPNSSEISIDHESSTDKIDTGITGTKPGTKPGTKLKIRGLQASMLSNGVRNKPLTEMLPPVYSASASTENVIKHPNVPVVIDPKLSKILRPHQVEGVRFLYRCVTGLVVKDFLKNKELAASLNIPSIPDLDPQGNENEETVKATEKALLQQQNNTKNKKNTDSSGGSNNTNSAKNAYGCVMADEMGLGKTLQCLALLWTLMKQGPRGKPMIHKAIIVCPSSLVGNWANEIIKWLGPGVLAPLAIDGKKHSTNGMTVANAIKQWGAATNRQITKPVLIISYETLRLNVKNLGDCEVGLMLADEGHRLKNEDSLTFVALNNINCNRRVILSGTPIQNDLSEYFALLNFSNPGLLGTRLEFRKNFELPIIRGRDADATEKQVAAGHQKLQDLSSIVSKFIIRRTNDILSKYLPCKYEHVVFVNMPNFQKNLYKAYIKEAGFADKNEDGTKKISASGITPLKAINIMKKICNHPDLIDIEEEMPNVDDSIIPDDYHPANLHRARSSIVQHWQSGKFSILQRMLHKIKTESDDKIVLISNYTQTLDLIEILCNNSGYGFIRLDGFQSVNKRQKIVDRFNDPENLNDFIFLLSSKAGGCGINLIGANRLILLDPDWNPASDQQALARVWRDGQKKDCFIYRFINTGSIEEKIYQRQTMKMGLSSCVVDEKDDVERLFSSENLRQLFEYDENTVCGTHETFNCKRCKNGEQMVRSPAMLYGDATTWNHLSHRSLQRTNDHLLREEFQHKEISFVFQYISHI
ncbi:hypothetical protein ACO0QE_003401 [Hanseniaspora vineae]